MLKKIISKDEKTLSLVDKQISVAEELREPLYELSRNTKIIENLSKTIQNIEQIEQFDHIKEEAKHIIRDLAHIKDKDDKIKKLGKQTISKFRAHRLKITKEGSPEESRKISLITVEEKEIIRDEERVIELVETDTHSIKLALNELEKITKNKFKLEDKQEAYATVSKSIIQIKHVYLTAQAIIQLESRIKQEEKELEEGFEEIKRAA